MLHANASIGTGIQGQRVLKSEQAIRKHGGLTEDIDKIRKRTRGSIRITAALGVIKDRYMEVANKSSADREEIKALLKKRA